MVLGIVTEKNDIMLNKSIFVTFVLQYVLCVIILWAA